MSEYRRPRARDGHERLFRALLVLFPRAFRAEFGDAMLEFFRDRLRDARAAHHGVATAWVATSRDLAREIPLAWIDAARRLLRATVARVTGNDVPQSLKTSRRKDWMISSIIGDVRHAVRSMGRAPLFSLVIVLTLTLGLGANIGIFSVVRGVLLTPLPYDRSEELVRATLVEMSVSEPEFADFRREVRAFQSLAAWAGTNANLTGVGGDAERVELARVTDGFFAVLRSPALLGRTFTADEERPGGPDVVVLSYALWKRRYGGDSSLVGRTIPINGAQHIVAGVMAERFAAPSEHAVAWVPLRLRYDSLWARNNHYLTLIGRLAPGATVAQATDQMAIMGRRWVGEYPEFYKASEPPRGDVRLLMDAMVEKTRPYLVALFAAVVFVLLIACVNVAGLLLARGEARRRELAIRVAMGGSRVRLMRTVFVESALHTLAGGALAVALAGWGVRLLKAAAPADLPRVGDIRVDGGVLGFALVAMIVTSVLFGVWPAWRAMHEDASDALRDGGKGSSGTTRTAARARRRLVIAEVAIAVVTLTGAGMALRSLWALGAMDLGFQAEGAMTMGISLPPAAYDDARRRAFYQQLEDRVRALPGVQHVGSVQDLPIGDGYSSLSILIDGTPATTVSQAPVATPQLVTPGYMKAMGMTLIRGRALGPEDGPDAPLVIVVNEAMVKKHWSAVDPIGRTVRMMGRPDGWATVVGVVKDVRQAGFSGEVEPTTYHPYAQSSRSAYNTPARMTLVVRTSGDPTVIVAPVRAAVREMDVAAPVSRVRTMEQVVAGSVATRRFATRLLAVFSALALGLAALGLYGVIAYSVAQRWQELGVRVALGAQRQQLLKLVLGEGLGVTVRGGVIGILAALALARVVRASVADVAAWDPVTLLAVVGLLLAVALVASFFPAQRASRVDPIWALREDQGRG